MEIKAIVFDFDGVCIDTETARYESWQEIYRSFGVVLPLDEWVKNIGRAAYESDPYPYLEKSVGRALNKEELHTIHKRTEVEITNRMPLMPGLLDRLHEAQSMGTMCAIASSSSHAWVDGHLQHRNIDHFFSTVVCREDTRQHKPDPEPYLTALRRLGVGAEHAVAVEDSPAGVTAARAAGIYTIAVPGCMTAAMNFEHASSRVASLAGVSWRTLAATL